MNVVLIGMKHCGKSTVGRSLAEAMQADFIDTDDRLAAVHSADTDRQLTVREIFRTVGPEGFADLERRVIRSLAEQSERRDRPWVIACGGRTATHRDLHAALHRLGRIVYLKLPADTLFERIMAGGCPPFLDADRPRESFEAHLAERQEAYTSLADVTVDLAGLNESQALATVRRVLSL